MMFKLGLMLLTVFPISLWFYLRNNQAVLSGGMIRDMDRLAERGLTYEDIPKYQSQNSIGTKFKQ
jgi:hypothetical protein